MQRMHIWAGAAIAFLVVALVGWLLLSPGWALSLAQDRVQQQLGRELQVGGGAHLDFSPLSIRLEQVSMAAAPGQDGAFLTAKSVHIPVSISQFLSRSADLSAIRIEGAEFAFLIDERGQASWNFPETKAVTGMSIEIENGSLRYFDARNEQGLMLGGVNAMAVIGSDDGMTLKGTAELNGRLARIEASLKSLARVHADGSPADLAIETPEGALSFNGRIATAKVLSLAGSVNVTSPSLRSAARWMGLTLDDGASFNKLTIDAALDTAGRAIAFRRASVTLDDTVLNGEVALDLRNAVPKLQAALAAPTLAIDHFLPPTGAKPGEWGAANLGFQALRAFDAEVTVETQALTYGPSSGLPARLGLSIGAGKLTSTIEILPEPDAGMTLATTIDATVLPTAISFDVQANSIETSNVLEALLGIDWLSCRGSISASLSGAGETQQEILGTLNGTANLALADGTLKGVDTKGMLTELARRILQGWASEPKGDTSFATLSSSFTVADGIATLGSFEFKTPEVTATASGEIDLLRRAVDLRVEPKQFATDGSVAEFPVGIIARGAWTAPRIYPDIPGIIENPAQGFEKLKSMSLSSNN